MSLISTLAEAAGVSVPVAESLLEPEFRELIESLGLIKPDRSKLAPLLRQRLQDKIDRDGMSAAEAALELGMTEGSFRTLMERGVPRLTPRKSQDGVDRFLKEELDEFRNSYLPRFKLWGTRTELLREFFMNLESQTRVRIAPENCAIPGCPDLAWVECANPTCRADGPPRKVCSIHREFLLDPSGKSLCVECVKRVLFDDLQDCFEIAGTTERLKREYQNG